MLSSWTVIAVFPILSFISKVVEKAAAEQIQAYLTANNLYSNLQSAYRKHHNTESALLRVRNDLLLAADKRKDAVLVLLDLSAAFNTIELIFGAHNSYKSADPIIFAAHNLYINSGTSAGLSLVFPENYQTDFSQTFAKKSLQMAAQQKQHQKQQKHLWAKYHRLLSTWRHNLIQSDRDMNVVANDVDVWVNVVN